VIDPYAPDGQPETQPTPSKRTRYLVQGAIAVLLLIAIVVVVLVVSTHNVTSAIHPDDSRTATPKNMASYGVLLTGKAGQISTVRTPAVKIGHPIATDSSPHSKPVNIVEYVDYQCPICLEFEEANLNNTASLVAGGQATLEIHPVAILDRSSQGTRYSSRAANAADCVANFDPDSFLAATAALYEYQPTEGTSGLTNAQILTALGKNDVGNAAITKCVNSETYREWVTATTAAVAAGKFEHVATIPTTFQGTPTVFVNGVQYTGSVTDPAAFTAFVAAQAAG
jgi:protein-disulfide isomerase